MIIQRGFRFLLEPTKEQLASFARNAGAARWVFNKGLELRREIAERKEKQPSYFDQNKQLTLWKRQEETAWLNEAHSQVLQQALKDLYRGYEAAFRRLKNGNAKPGFPKFKKKGEKDSFRFPQNVRVEGNRVKLPGIGWVSFIKSREIQGTIKQATVSLSGKRWYISFSCEWEQADPEKPLPNHQTAVGIDVGTRHFATLVKGEENRAEQVENPRFLQKMLSKLRRLQRRLSKKVKFSKNWIKLKLQIQILHSRIKNCRLDFLHKLSTRLVKNHDVLCVESLDISSLLEQAPRPLARSISDVGWGIFFRLLTYKAEEKGKHLIALDRYFAGSQICSCCGHQQKMPLEMRQYVCPSCGISLDRDVNAAINYKTAGISVLNACGAVS